MPQERDVGPIHCAVYNIGAQRGQLSLADTSYEDFEAALSFGVIGVRPPCPSAAAPLS